MADDPYSSFFGDQPAASVGGADPYAHLFNTPAASPSFDSSAIHQDFQDLAQTHGATITSLDRTPEHNAAVGGVPDSQHLRGTAGDFVVPPANKADFIAAATQRGYQPIDEGTHIHLQLPHGGGSGGVPPSDPYAAFFGGGSVAPSPTPVSAAPKPIQATAAPASPMTNPLSDLGGSLANIAQAINPFPARTNGSINPANTYTPTEPSVFGFLHDMPQRAADAGIQGVHDAINYFRTTPKEQISADMQANAKEMTPWNQAYNLGSGINQGIGEASSSLGNLIDTAFPKTGEALKGGGELLQIGGGSTAPNPTFVGRVQHTIGQQFPTLAVALAAPELNGAKLLPTISKIPGAGAFLERLVSQSPRAGVLTLAQLGQNPNMTLQELTTAAGTNLAMFATPGMVNSPNAGVRAVSAAAGNMALNTAAGLAQGQMPSLESNVAQGLIGGVIGASSHSPTVPRIEQPEVSHVVPTGEAGHPPVEAVSNLRPTTPEPDNGVRPAGNEGSQPSAETVSVKPKLVYRDGQSVPAESAPAEPAAQPSGASVSTKEEMMQAARVARGEEPLPVSKTPTRDEQAATAAAAMQINPNLPHEIIARKLAGEDTISTQDEAVLQRHAVDLTNQMAEQARLAADPNATPEARDIALAKHDELAKQFGQLDQATKLTGKNWSDWGRQRMQQLLNDYTFENLVRRRQAGLQRPLNAQETTDARATADKAKSLQDAIAANEAATAGERANEDSLAAYSTMAKSLAKALGTERKGGLSAVADGIRRRAAEGRQFLAGTESVASNKGQSGAVLDPRSLYHLANIGAEHILNGFSKFGDWVGKMKDDLGDRFARLMPGKPDQMAVFNAAKAIHDEAKRTGSTPDEVRTRQLEKRLADLQDGKQRAGKMQGPDTAEEAGLKKQISDINDRNRILRQMDALRSKIATQDFAPKGRNTKALSEENIRLKYEYQKLKNDYTDSLVRDRFAKMGIGEKFGNFLLGMQRFMILSHLTTIGKLVSAATQRIGFTPLEDIAGSLHNLVPGYKRAISSGAPTEGQGFSPRAYASGLGHAFSGETIREMGRLIADGQSKMDVLHSLHNDPGQFPYLEYAQRLHAVLKSPAKINEFYASLAKQVASERAAMLKSGLSAEDTDRQLQQPEKQAQMQAKAMEKGKRAILMQDNAFSNWYQSTLANLARTGAIGKVGSFIGHALVPIVKIPSNFLTEVGSHVGGSGPALYRIVSKGIDNLTPEDKDFIARNFKKQTIGLSLLALGYFGVGNGIQAGGYYDKKHQPKPGGPDFGGLQLFGVNIPRFLVHSPQLEMLQIGATLRRYMDSKQQGERTDPQKALAATVGIGRGLAEETPTLETAMNLSQAAESPKAAGNFAGREAASFYQPGFVQDIAKWMDSQKRKPQGFIDTQKMGIPGLRQQVPTAAQVKARQELARQSGGR